MYEKTFALDVSGMEQAQVLTYLDTLMQALGVRGGPGTRSLLQASLSIRASDVFRFLTGAPDDWLTTERQRFAEAAYSVAFGCSLSSAHERWSESASWMPTNIRRHGDLATARIDLDFIDQFGMNQAGWDEAFGMSGFLSRAAKGSDSAADRIRAVVGLSMLGFRDPMQFFTAR